MVINKDATDYQKEVIAFRCPNDLNVNEVTEFDVALYITVNCDIRHLKKHSQHRINVQTTVEKKYSLIYPAKDINF